MAGQNPKWQKAGFKNPPTPAAGDMTDAKKNIAPDQKRSSNIGVNARGGAPTRPAETDPRGYKRVG